MIDNTTQRPIPGTITGRGRFFLYIMTPEGGSEVDLLHLVLGAVDTVKKAAERGRPARGAVLPERCKVTCPSGQSFLAYSFKADPDIWREYLLEGAKVKNILTAEIIEDQFTVSNGQTFPLHECSIYFF